MPKVNFLNPRTVFKKMTGLLALATIGAGVYFTPNAVESIRDYREESQRESQIETYIQEGKTDEASSLVTGYKASSLISESDFISFNTKISSVKKDNEIKVKLKSLDELINSGNYEEAKKAQEQMRQEGILNDSLAYSALDTLAKIESISPSNVLDRISKSIGEDRIKNIESFIRNNPNTQNLDELRRKELEAYLETSNAYFKARTSPEKVSEFLGEFRTFLSGNDRKIAEGLDFEGFFNESENYVRTILPGYYADIQIGDEVEVVRKLGGVIKKELEGKYCYESTRAVDVLLNSTGVVSRDFYHGDDTGTSGIEVKISDQKYWFLKREVRKLEDTSLVKLYENLGEIKNYVSGKINNTPEKTEIESTQAVEGVKNASWS